MKHHHFRTVTAAIGALLLLAAAAMVFADVAARLRFHCRGFARPLILRTAILCLLMMGFLVALGLIFFSIQREKTRQLSMERGRFYLLSHFSDTYLFEYEFGSGQLRLSDNAPAALDLPFPSTGPMPADALKAAVHPDDWARLLSLRQTPPQSGQEARLEFRLRHSDGNYVWYECKALTVHDERGHPLLLMGRFEDINVRKTREALLLARSTLDDLTGLLNRSAVALRVEEYLRTPCAGQGGALLMLDLDNFKAINDTCGHATGDRALLLTAQILRETFRGSDILGRAGGDEFLVFMTGVRDRGLVEKKAWELCRRLEDRCAADCCAFTCTCSVGAALYPRDGDRYSALFEAADAAMYQAKREGKNAFHFYDCG